MSSRRIEQTRIQPLNDQPVRRGDYVLYWMQQSQRAHFNHALEYAVQRANAPLAASEDHPSGGRALLVAFGLMDNYPEANLRHYRFMLEGLAQTREALEKRGIQLVVRRGHPAEVALELGRRASLIVCDRGYLRHQKRWRERVADEAACAVVRVEADVVVPVEVASDKAEYAARTLRPKVSRQRDGYLRDLRPTPVKRRSLDLPLRGEDLDDLEGLLASMNIDRTVRPHPMFRGGENEARRRLRDFVDHRLPRYNSNRRHAEHDDVSHMSPYLHFGQISPVYVGMRVRDADAGLAEERSTYLEQLLVRRELAQNFCAFTPDYDRYRGLPDWAKRTLARHRDDRRPHLYTKRQLENARTHDPYWNAAMREMRCTGYMHNYMRLYWGKKIIEWTNTPQYAHAVALELNNRYFLDGRDPNSFTNVNWIFGLHDRPWPERPVFGKVRYMSAAGLERKARPQAYVAKVNRLVRQAGAQT